MAQNVLELGAKKRGKTRFYLVNGHLRQFKSSEREVIQKHLTYNVGYDWIYLPYTTCKLFIKKFQVLD